MFLEEAFVLLKTKGCTGMFTNNTVKKSVVDQHMYDWKETLDSDLAVVRIDTGVQFSFSYF